MQRSSGSKMKLGLTLIFIINDDETFTQETFKEILNNGRRIIEVTSGNGKFHHYFEQIFFILDCDILLGLFDGKRGYT